MEFFSSPPCPDQLWGAPSLLSNGYRGCYSGGKAAGAWSWPHLQQVPRSRMRGAIPPLHNTSSWRVTWL